MSERAAVSPSADVQHQAQRHQLILRKLRTEGQVRAVDLARDLGVTHETIRKDLLLLDGRGLLRKVHGGALPVEALSYEPNVETRNALSAEKRRIAVAAAELVPTEGGILLDAGSTTAALAESFPT